MVIKFYGGPWLQETSNKPEHILREHELDRQSKWQSMKNYFTTIT